jgi:solute carrier family 38 (sodium-coupled neutral amino acid transporter), member 11
MPSVKPPGSPFFAPSTQTVTTTPGGTKRTVKVSVEETKSGIVGTTANLINAIVGSGIVGIPYAIYCSGLVTGVLLVILCALLTMISLRLLIFTAQHVKATSYETLCEASFGRLGFLFITSNMFIMAYGAMISYLMIVKDTLPLVFGIDETNTSMKRAILFVVSLTFMVPLSAQRDMADLAKTSRLSVACDCIMVGLVAYNAPRNGPPILETIQHSIFEPTTVFIGLGVLSFAFVCQHSAFIIAGSLDQPTKTRWSAVTRNALSICVVLALVCGITGYLGFRENTQGNILNNLDPTNLSSNIARGLLGSTMLFVYPMESFVARHVLVVLLFQGRRAHEGDDATILHRRDRRWGMTLLLYVLALIPALLFENVGPVLSITGAIGGSCLSYIGPGMCYLGVYGSDFMTFTQQWFAPKASPPPIRNEEQLPLTTVTVTTDTIVTPDSCCMSMVKAWVYFSFGMPLWTRIATIGAAGLEDHQAKKALQSPHISRIAAARKATTTYQHPAPANLQPPVRPVIRPFSKIQQRETEVAKATIPAVEDSMHTPSAADFIVAILFMLFGVVAMLVGLGSIFVAGGS